MLAGILSPGPDSTDRQLLAFRAVAALVQEGNPHDEYLAGIWRSHLLQGLCWASRPDETTLYAGYVAPSWSWASVSGPVEHTTLMNWPPVIGAEKDALVEDAWCKTSGPLPLGPVTDGALVLSAYSCEARLRLEHDEHPSRWVVLLFGDHEYEFRIKRFSFFHFDTNIVAQPHPFQEHAYVLQRDPRPVEVCITNWKAFDGYVRLVRLCEDFWLILTHARRDASVYERIGMLETRCTLPEQEDVKERLLASSIRSQITIV